MNAEKMSIMYHSAWNTVDEIPIGAKTDKPELHSLIEAIDVFADERTRMYRRESTQEFLFAVYYCGDLFIVGGLARENALTLGLFWNEMTITTAKAFGISQLIRLCGLRHGDWCLVGEIVRAVQREELVRILARLDYGMIEANWDESFGPLPKFNETISGITTALREGIRALIEEPKRKA